MSRIEPVDPPPGFRWYFNTHTLTRRLGRLELLPSAVTTDEISGHWIQEPAPGRKHNPRIRPYFPESEPIERETQIRSASRRIVRAHYARLAEEAAAKAAAARIASRLRCGE